MKGLCTFTGHPRQHDSGISFLCRCLKIIILTLSCIAIGMAGLHFCFCRFPTTCDDQNPLSSTQASEA